MSLLITGQRVKQVVETLSLQRAENIAQLCREYCPAYGITTYDIFHEFFATLAHESGYFRRRAENMNYTAARIVEVWPSRFKTIAQAAPYARNPQALANKVYGGRMGNVLPNDGWNMRGSGFIMVTGREMAEEYLQYKRWINLLSAEKAMEKLRTEDTWAMDSACWVFAIQKKLIPLAIADKFETITRRVNGGLIGWADRKLLYNRSVKVFR